MRITCIWAHGLLVCGVLGLVAASVVPMAHATPKRAERKSPPAAKRVQASLPATPSPSAPPSQAVRPAEAEAVRCPCRAA
jgi:hypothetical protein